LLVTHDPAEAARLGDSVQIMTSEGLENIAVPNSPIPRPVTAPEVLSTQADLLTRLRKGHG
jgi:putative hydroxymethylpyrimidine transport system ATP-binding protein